MLFLQSGLGIQDLGKFYYAPTRDPNGSIVLTTVGRVRDPKSISTAHTKWIGMSKVQRKVSSSDQLSAPEQLLLSTNVSEINYIYRPRLTRREFWEILPRWCCEKLVAFNHIFCGIIIFYWSVSTFGGSVAQHLLSYWAFMVMIMIKMASHWHRIHIGSVLELQLVNSYFSD